MISCTEFIPCYSELFTYLEEKHGRDEVEHLWEYLFKPTGEGNPLINFLKNEGLHGCWSYWTGSLNEEAAEFTMYLNEKRGFFMIDMHRCPSKGRLLDLKDELGIEPYLDYCLHCDGYRAAVEKVGLKYIYNFNGVDHAACCILIYDDKIFDGRVIIDKDTLVMDRKAADNEYFHRDFHSGMNQGIEYLGSKFGLEEVTEFLTRYTKNVHRRTIEAIKQEGLAAIEKNIIETYRKEKMEDVLTTVLADNTLAVSVTYCPAVQHLHATGRTVSAWYRYTTEIVMKTFAEAGGYKFTMESYDEETGAAVYRFE
ncbi:MAG: hypothetical protein J6C37_09175 [Roseburia sp.]|nr:hypothetical protein [Roseburia sp.]